MLYLDYAATAPIDPEIARGLLERFETHFGNPKSHHGAGRHARGLLDEARAELATMIGAQPGQLLFTGGGTEAIGLAVLGSAGDKPAHIAFSSVEHNASRHAAGFLRDRLGWTVSEIPVDALGQVLPEAVEATITPETRIVSVMMVNNEVGAINDIAAIARVVRRVAPRAKLVVDGVQGFAKLPVNVAEMDADLFAFTAHKIHGPKGVGALYARRPEALRPVFQGGGQEAGVRGGTQSAPLAWAFAEAAKRYVDDRHAMGAKGQAYFNMLRQRVPDLQLVGPEFGADRASTIVSVHLPYLPSGPLLEGLAQAGLCCSAGSACKGTGGDKFSPVLAAMGRDDAGAYLRFSIGRPTTDDELAKAADIFADVVADLSEVYR